MVLGIRQKQVDFNFHFKYMVDIFDLLFIVKHCWNNFFKIKTPEFMYHLKKKNLKKKKKKKGIELQPAIQLG